MYDTFKCGFDCIYKVVQEKSNFYAIYLYHWGEKRFLTHRRSLRSAQKVAKLLAEAYQQGREDERE